MFIVHDWQSTSMRHQASMGRTPGHIPPSTMVLHHTLPDNLDHMPSTHTPSTFPPEHLCPPHHSNSSFCSTYPNYLHVHLWILFLTHSSPKQIKSSSLCSFFCKDTSHTPLTIILCLHQPIQPLSFHHPHFSPIYNHPHSMSTFVFPGRHVLNNLDGCFPVESY